jgi:hypothetical protein
VKARKKARRLPPGVPVAAQRIGGAASEPTSFASCSTTTCPRRPGGTVSHGPHSRGLSGTTPRIATAAAGPSSIRRCRRGPPGLSCVTGQDGCWSRRSRNATARECPCDKRLSRKRKSGRPGGPFALLRPVTRREPHDETLLGRWSL